LYTLSLGHYVMRALMAEASARVPLDPERLLRLCLPECTSQSPEAFRAWYRRLLAEMGRSSCCHGGTGSTRG